VITIADWITETIASWTSRPVIRAWRPTGETRNRSMTPRLRSSITPMPAQPPAKAPVMTTIPGVR
jgi:hypothetical protein